MKIDFQKQKLLPPEIIERLQEMIRRIRRIQIIRGTLATLGMALATSLTVMAIDAAVVIYSESLRAMFSLGALVITGFTAWMSLVRPLCDKITLVRMARILETRHPELQERISSALELLSTGEVSADDASRGVSAEEGNELYALLARDAKKDIDSVSVRSEFRGTTIRPAAILAAITFAILCFLFAVWPKQTALLFVRAVAPAHPTDNLAARLFTVTPGDISVYSGESVVFTLTVPGTTSSRAELHVEYSDNATIERLSRRYGTDDNNAVFEMKMTAVKGTFRYRMCLGDALTRYYTVTAIPPPAHTDLNYTFDFPEYTGLGSTQFVASVPVPIRVPHGTRATITTTSNRKLDSAILLGDLRKIAPVDTPDPAPGDPQLLAFDWLVTTNSARSWSIALREYSDPKAEVDDNSSEFRVQGSESDGRARRPATADDRAVSMKPPQDSDLDEDDSSLPEFLRTAKAAEKKAAKKSTEKPWIVSESASYEAVPDYPPHLQLAYPSGNSYVLPTYGLLKMVFEARDDYGFTSATLMVQPDNYRTPWEVDVEAEKIDNRNWCITKNLALDEFQLSGARKLRIWLEISDNLPPELGGPNKSKSRVIALNIDNSQNRSLADQVRIPERDSINELLNAAASRLEATANALKQGKSFEKIEEERAAEEEKYREQLERQRENEQRGKSKEEVAAMKRETPKSIAEDQKMASPEEQLAAAAKIADEGLFAGLAPEIAQVAEEKAAEALAAAADIALTEEEERAKATEDAIAALIAAADATREMLPEVEKKDKILGEAAVIDEIATREARLAEQANAKIMTEEEKAKWQKAQEELAAKVDSLEFLKEQEKEREEAEKAKAANGYDLANDVDKDSQAVVAPMPEEKSQVQVPSPSPAPQPSDPEAEAAKGIAAKGQESPEPKAQSPMPDENARASRPATAADGKNPDNSVNPVKENTDPEARNSSEAVSLAKQAKEALASAPKRDDAAIKQAREAEAIARQAKESIANSKNAIENTGKMEKENAELTDIQKKAEKVQKAAEAAENAALEVKMQAEAAKTEAMPEDIRKALDLVRDTEALADSLDKLPPAEAAAKAAALAAEAEKILESKETASNPFLQKAAKQAAEVAKKAEEVVSALRAADREGISDEKAGEAKEKAKAGTEEAKDIADNAASDLAMEMLTPQEAAVKLAKDAGEAAKSAENAIEKLTAPKEAKLETETQDRDQGPASNPSDPKAEHKHGAADHPSDPKDDTAKGIAAKGQESPESEKDGENPDNPVNPVENKPDLKAKDMENQARQAQEAVNKARSKGANISAEAADKAKNANLEAKQAMDAAERAAQAKSEGKMPQYEQLVNEAKRHAERAKALADEAEKKADEVADKPSDHAVEAFQNAADAAEKVADELAKALGLEKLSDQAPALAAREADQAAAKAKAEQEKLKAEAEAAAKESSEFSVQSSESQPAHPSDPKADAAKEAQSPEPKAQSPASESSDPKADTAKEAQSPEPKAQSPASESSDPKADTAKEAQSPEPRAQSPASESSDPKADTAKEAQSPEPRAQSLASESSDPKADTAKGSAAKGQESSEPKAQSPKPEEDGRAGVPPPAADEEHKAKNAEDEKKAPGEKNSAFRLPPSALDKPIPPRERKDGETADLAREAQEAAQKAERAASDAREQQTTQAAQAARELAQKAVNAENQLKALQGNNSPEAKAQRENLLRDLENTFKKAEQLAGLSAETPGEQVADMARKEEKAAEALAETAKKVEEASKELADANAEKREAQKKMNEAKGDQKIIDEAKAEMEQADKKAAEAREKLAEAAKEADKAARDFQNQANNMQPVIQNAQRLGKKRETDAATDLRNDMNNMAQKANELRNAANSSMNGNTKYGEETGKRIADQSEEKAQKAENAAEKFKPENGLDPLANAVKKAAEAGKGVEDTLSEIPDYNREYDAAVARLQAPRNASAKPADTLRDRLGDAVQKAIEAAQMMPEDAQDSKFMPSSDKPFDNDAVEDINDIAERADRAAEAARAAATEAEATSEIASNAMTNRLDSINKSLGRADSLGKDSSSRAAKFMQAAERAAQQAAQAQAQSPESKAQETDSEPSDTQADAFKGPAVDAEGLARQFSPERSYELAKALTNATAMASAIAAQAKDFQDAARERLAAAQNSVSDEPNSASSDPQADAAKGSAAKGQESPEPKAQSPEPEEDGRASRPATAADGEAEAQQNETKSFADQGAEPKTGGEPQDSAENSSALRLPPSALSAAHEAAAAAEREARAMQAPDAAQKEAARFANRAAAGIKRMAAEHAKKAGLDPQTMRPKRNNGGQKDPSQKGKNSQPEKGEKNDSEEPSEGAEENTLPPDADDSTLELPEWLRRLGFPLSEWVKYRNSLDSGTLESALDKVAPEYRDLVRRYFQILATDQGK